MRGGSLTLLKDHMLYFSNVNDKVRIWVLCIALIKLLIELIQKFQLATFSSRLATEDFASAVEQVWKTPTCVNEPDESR